MEEGGVTVMAAGMSTVAEETTEASPGRSRGGDGRG
jgi:hypothetical protein